MNQGQIVFCFEGINNRVWSMEERLNERQLDMVLNYCDRTRSITGIDYFQKMKQGKTGDELKDARVELFMTYICDCAIFQSYVESGIKPEMLIGYSLGLNTAMVCSGAISFEDGIFISEKLSEYMKYTKQQFQFGMALEVGIPFEETVKYLSKSHMEDRVHIASENSEHCILLTGEVGALEQLEDVFVEEGALKYNILKTFIPYHFKEELWTKDVLHIFDMLTVKESAYPIFSVYSLEVMREALELQEELKRNVNEQMMWRCAIEKLELLGYRRFYDVSLTGGNKKITVLSNNDSKFITLKKFNRGKCGKSV